MPAATAVAAEWLRQTPGIELIAVGHRVVHGGPDYDRPVLIDENVLARLERLLRLHRLHQPNNLALIRSLRKLRPGLVSDRLLRYGLSSYRTVLLSITMQYLNTSIAKASGGTDFTGFLMNTSPARLHEIAPASPKDA